jgi:hypothetical protein
MASLERGFGALDQLLADDQLVTERDSQVVTGLIIGRLKRRGCGRREGRSVSMGGLPSVAMAVTMAPNACSVPWSPWVALPGTRFEGFVVNLLAGPVAWERQVAIDDQHGNTGRVGGID